MANDINGLSGVNSITLGSSVSSTIAPRSTSSFGQFLERIMGKVTGITEFTAAGIDPTYGSLLNQQVEMQKQMQLVSLYSNILKSEHETQMAAVRNIRVG